VPDQRKRDEEDGMGDDDHITTSVGLNRVLSLMEDTDMRVILHYMREFHTAYNPERRNNSRAYAPSYRES
jgi:hypothetical protein